VTATPRMPYLGGGGVVVERVVMVDYVVMVVLFTYCVSNAFYWCCLGTISINNNFCLYNNIVLISINKY